MKLTRAQARRQVHASAERYSTVMLEHENACFDRVARAFTGPPAVPFKTVAGFRNNAAARTALVDAFQGRVYDCLGHVETLAGHAATRARTSIRRELFICEQGLPAAHAGRTRRALDAVDTDRIVTDKLWVWKSTVGGLHGVFRSQLTDLLGRSTEIGQVTDGLFGGRGRWYAGVPYLQMHARGMAVAVGNEVRLQAMAAFNA